MLTLFEKVVFSIFAIIEKCIDFIADPDKKSIVYLKSLPDRIQFFLSDGIERDKFFYFMAPQFIDYQSDFNNVWDFLEGYVNNIDLNRPINYYLDNVSLTMDDVDKSVQAANFLTLADTFPPWKEMKFYYKTIIMPNYEKFLSFGRALNLRDNETINIINFLSIERPYESDSSRTFGYNHVAYSNAHCAFLKKIVMRSTVRDMITSANGNVAEYEKDIAVIKKFLATKYITLQNTKELLNSLSSLFKHTEKMVTDSMKSYGFDTNWYKYNFNSIDNFNIEILLKNANEVSQLILKSYYCDEDFGDFLNGCIDLMKNLYRLCKNEPDMFKPIRKLLTKNEILKQLDQYLFN